MLKIIKLYAGYRKNDYILRDIDLEILTGESFALIGQNGAGKSTLGKAIINNLPFKTGKVIFNEIEISSFLTEKIISSGIGVFLQGGRTFPHLTVKENLFFSGRRLRKKELLFRIDELKQYFDLLQEDNNHLMKTKSSYLSGGERHQLAMLMSVLNKPSMLILDEPSSGMSPISTDKIYIILRNLIDNEHTTVLLIEQNVNEAVRFSDRIGLLKNGQLEYILDSKSAQTVKNINDFYFDGNEF